ncbi:MAG: hypothetical protein ACLFUH_01820 [Bacteroidales bacterium]
MTKDEQIEKLENDLLSAQEEIHRLRSIVRNSEHEMLTKLAKFEHNVDMEEFMCIFGDNMGYHFWQKFINFRHSILLLWGVMDDKWRGVLADYLHKEY